MLRAPDAHNSWEAHCLPPRLGNQGLEQEMRFTKTFDAEISANRQYVVEAPGGNFALAKTFGGRASRSGATLWPEWVQDGARKIKPLSLLTEHDIDNEVVVAFSGGGQRRVALYSASTEAVRDALAVWRKWRKFEAPEKECPPATEEEAEAAPPRRSRLHRRPEPELSAKTDAEWIARAISFNESCKTEGQRLTNHEVSRYAQNISFWWDEGSGSNRWTATMTLWPFMATALDDGVGPVAWTIYEAQSSCVDATGDDFVEVEEEEV